MGQKEVIIMAADAYAGGASPMDIAIEAALVAALVAQAALSCLLARWARAGDVARAGRSQAWLLASGIASVGLLLAAFLESYPHGSGTWPSVVSVAAMAAIGDALVFARARDRKGGENGGCPLFQQAFYAAADLVVAVCVCVVAANHSLGTGLSPDEARFERASVVSAGVCLLAVALVGSRLATRRCGRFFERHAATIGAGLIAIAAMFVAAVQVDSRIPGDIAFWWGLVPEGTNEVGLSALVVMLTSSGLALIFSGRGHREYLLICAVFVPALLLSLGADAASAVALAAGLALLVRDSAGNRLATAACVSIMVIFLCFGLETSPAANADWDEFVGTASFGSGLEALDGAGPLTRLGSFPAPERVSLGNVSGLVAQLGVPVSLALLAVVVAAVAAAAIQDRGAFLCGPVLSTGLCFSVIVVLGIAQDLDLIPGGGPVPLLSVDLFAMCSCIMPLVAMTAAPVIRRIDHDRTPRALDPLFWGIFATGEEPAQKTR